ncbi:MAG: leucyl aminopeptidase family protein, partial [Rhodobacteraceae bacterium]
MSAEFFFLSDRPAMRFAQSGEESRPLIPVAPDGLEAALGELPPAQAAFVTAQGFKAGAGQVILLPGAEGVEGALVGLGAAVKRARERFALARATEALPEGAWEFTGAWPKEMAEEAALGWLFAGYRFARYAESAPPKARLVCPEGLDAARLEAIAEGEAFTRDLINT